MNEVPAPRVGAREFVLLALLAMAASAPSITNGFAYDDRWIIETNNRVHDLHRWADWLRTSYWPTREGSLYRPLTTAGFALQWAIGGGAPWVFHAVNIVLYALGVVAFTWFASLLLPAAAAIVVGALFAVDPVHVEAVGNVVGQSELSAGLVMLCATAIYVRARRAGGMTPRATFAIAALYFGGSMLKEHVIVLPAWLFAAEITLFREAGSLRDRIRTLAPAYAIMAALGACVIAIRWTVLDALGGDIPHPVLLGLTMSQRVFVMLGVLPDLARLLVWPAQLYADYSPGHVIVSSSPDVSQINGLVVIVGVILLLAVAWKRSATAAFGVLIAALVWLPTANIVFPSGVLLAERTMYLPSAGVLLALGVLVAWAIPRLHLRATLQFAAGGVLAAVLVLGIARSAERQRAWRSTDDAFLVMLRDEPLSFRAHYGWGGVLFERGDLVGGELEWRKALRIFPSYHKIYQDLAGRYLQYHRCDLAMPLYQRAIELGGALPLSRAGTVACQLELARFRAARETARLGVLDGNDPDWFRARLFTADSALAALDSLKR